MAIPVYLQQFKAAGIYRVVFDKSTMLNQNSEILRLVVGYSEQGPFNIPTYVPNVGTFKTLYGDVSKKLEKRGVWFHRMAQQALASGPILALNLKKFEDEAVGAATIDTDFNPKFDAIALEEVYVEDIYDTSRFWELSAEKMNDMRTKDGSSLDKYINICTTDTEKSSATFFIRKAVGSVVSNYKVTLNDWYTGDADPMPEYLEDAKSTLVSDYMAEVFVFKGKFSKEQVLASTSLKKHFTTDENGELVLRKFELDAFGEPVDSLAALYNDETSGAIGHYVGSLIPYMKNKKGQYISLDIVFNEDQHLHSMMMSFNTDMLEEDVPANINISGKAHISDALLADICQGDAVVSVLGNKNVEVVAESLRYSNNIADDYIGNYNFEIGAKKITGLMVVAGKEEKDGNIVVKLGHLINKKSGDGIICGALDSKFVELTFKAAEAEKVDYIFGNVLELAEGELLDYHNPACWCGKHIITSLKNISKTHDYYEGDAIKASKVAFATTVFSDPTFGHSGHTHVYNSSLSFVQYNDNWNMVIKEAEGDNPAMAYLFTTTKDNSLLSVLNVGDAIVAADKDRNGFHRQAFITAIDSVSAAEHIWYRPIGVTDTVIDATVYEKLSDAEKAEYEATDYTTITFTEAPFIHADKAHQYEIEKDENGNPKKDDNGNVIYLLDEEGNPIPSVDPSHYGTDAYGAESWIVRLDADLCQENGIIRPIFLKGYTYGHLKPDGTDMLSKLEWQNKYMLAALTDYKGLRTGLLNKSDIDYRYIIDTFETFVEIGAKKVLSFLAKEKQSAFAILNFPAVKSFVKCPYASYVNDKGVFNVQYVVDGYNKKKAHSSGFSLPSDDEGASFCAFYSPLKFSDGYVDSIVPSAALVSNLFMQKYLSRQPYYIVAGPTHGVISASGLIGPDYNYSKEELNIIEPYGVNCMVYRPNFGTFINANQTAKQTPLSALSRVNVRELVIYLQDEVEKVLQAYQWEFNNATTRNAILTKANAICANIQANGGIQAFTNIMDESNNTPEIIDNEMAILSTHIEPGFGCGKMVHELTIYKTGGLSSAVK